VAALDGDVAAIVYHRYVQFVAEEQMRAARTVTESGGAGLYLDLPLGVHPDGFDPWYAPESFASASVGSPPDDFFPGGQNWGFPPPHPDRIRESGYRYYIDCLRRVLRYASAIRLDHVLGLQRLFWLPEESDEGAYVRYRTEELRAVVAIEAERADAVVVGEDLGTVAPEILHAMDHDNILHSFVYQFEASADDPFPEPRSPSLASFGTHDLPRFAAFWRGRDIDEKQSSGVLDEESAEAERARRTALIEAVAAKATSTPGNEPERQALVDTTLALAESPARLVVIDLADYQLEERPENRPGTGPEADNWRLRAPQPLEEITADRELASFLSTVARRRKTSARSMRTRGAR
jgi:4-alpha-glucanotransferase